MKIETSLDWDSVRRELNGQIQVLPYDRSVRQMIKNISTMVSELSRLEVDKRRTKVSYYTDSKLAEVNNSIDRLEKLILIAMLTT